MRRPTANVAHERARRKSLETTAASLKAELQRLVDDRDEAVQKLEQAQEDVEGANQKAAALQEQLSQAHALLHAEQTRRGRPGRSDQPGARALDSKIDRWQSGPGLVGSESRGGLNGMLSIVIPLYNEEQRLPLMREAIARFSSMGNLPFRKLEWVLVDDGSADATWEGIGEIVRELEAVGAGQAFED